MTELRKVIDDLATDADEVDQMVAGIDDAAWDTPTPAPGWTVKHQIGHLAFIFRIAGMAAAEPDTFNAMTTGIANGAGFDAAVNGALADYVGDPPEALLNRWRAERDAGIKALAAVPEGQLVPWLVNPLPPQVLAAAGMMELFGHGQDIADALGVRREHTDRLIHVVEFAVRTRDFGYQSRGITPPETEFRFELVSPGGQLLEYGPEDADQRVSGSAVDFCLLTARRRHRDDLMLQAVGEEADRWLDIAQAYRGPAGEGRKPGQFQN